MSGFNKASTLQEDYSQKPKPPRRGSRTSKSFKSKTRKCIHYASGICEVSREAFKLGLRETVFPCNGNIPPDCIIRQKLEAGMIIQEVLGES